MSPEKHEYFHTVENPEELDFPPGSRRPEPALAHKHKDLETDPDRELSPIPKADEPSDEPALPDEP